MSHILAPFQLLELNVISAQDLAPVGRSMRTYAVAWVHPDRKLSTRVDTESHTNPTWNDKFVFRVNEEFLHADTSAIMVEIYALHWFKDIHVGTVRVLVANLIPPPSKPFNNNHAPTGMRFVALQVRRSSGKPQGILNIGAAVLDSSMRSMPLYTHNPSAVGYRHLMGETDAYENHNHIMSPQVFATNNAELRRTKSDTSSMIGSEVMAQQHRTNGNKGKASSVITDSEVSAKSIKHKSKKKKKEKRKKSRSKTSSMLSGFSDGNAKREKTTDSILSISTLPNNDNIHHQDENMNHNEQIAYIASVSEMKVEPSLSLPPPRPLSPSMNNDDRNKEFGHVDKNKKIVTSINTLSETAENNVDMNINPLHEQIPITNIAKPQFLNSPAPQFRNSPKPQYRNSPALEFRNSPAPEFRNSPAPEFRNSPAPEFRNSPAPEFRNSPAPEFRNSPAPEFRNSPAPEFRNSPAPEFRNSPAPEFRNSPAPEFRNSPRPQFRNSPAVATQFRNSPAPQYHQSPAPKYLQSPALKYLNSPAVQQFRNSPKPQFHNSPVMAPQFRNSPAMSKFNPAIGISSSHRGTPFHPAGRLSNTFDMYGTPRRSNMGNVVPPVITESELGPSPSEVAEAIARKPVFNEGDNSTVGGWSLDELSVEGLQSKLERWRTELPPVVDRGESSYQKTSSTKSKSKSSSRHIRRNTDGGAGLFSCFSNICGVECSIVCGGPKPNKNQRHHAPSENNTSFL
ncbi:hypothetical protein TanjilG_32108 [Lupinus angustifolius]|uniref:C2 domain-containing protein n=1 Tax=Lupinus angustifolius TaxID=3871 RepID=A0A1J7HJT7_LUPAN|nr:PREDICTED: uncharacterized protein LOC109346140 [Lupinus angustifolius]OIW13127.1 hypothetical protein TanjilG_32108 [Lupinus angustifolius]